MLAFSLLSCFSAQTGKPAPAFSIASGDDKVVNRDTFKNRLLIIIYETKDNVEDNRKFKTELGALLASSDTLKNSSTVLPVINCSSAFWPVSAIWKGNLMRNSEKEKITIYGDWDGKMFSSYKFKDKASNVVIVDKDGIIRYFHTGVMDDDDIREARNVIVSLA